jgi:hypothetical protein
VSVPPDTPAYRPSVADVAALLRARTKDAEGREVGTFNEDTRPTDVDVELHISAAVALVGIQIPIGYPDNFTEAVRSLVAYRAALRVEKSYFPEQVRSDRSAYEQLRQEYVDDLQALTDALAASDASGYGSSGSRAHSEATPTYLSQAGPWLDDYWPEPENPENWQDPLQPPRDPPLPQDVPVGDRPASGQSLR